MANRTLVIFLVAALCLAALPQGRAQDADSDDSSLSSGSFGGMFRSVMTKASSLLKKATNAVVSFAITKTSGDEICFGLLGCFSLKNPWVSGDRPLPAPAGPEDIKPSFYLYSRAAPQRFTIVSDPQMTIKGAPYDGTKPTFFIVHGYLSTGDIPWMTNLKDALLKKVDGNVFIVDWGKGSKDQYLKVAANTRVVGRTLSWFGQLLMVEAGANPADFHFLGHSLGAHICGYAARNITNVGRITAFDPAGPTFDGQNMKVRLGTDCAKYVEAIHTNAKPLTSMGFGAMRPLAHVDIYVNGGVNQPGCDSSESTEKADSITSWLTLSMEAMASMITCSHGRAVEYYIEALNNPDCVMWAHKVTLARQYLRWIVGEPYDVPERTGKCRNAKCVPLGMDVPKYPTRGAFSLTTNPKEPYCIKDRSDDGQDLATLERLGLL